jgi:protein-S-isoprenylcysteine O-methyltransferase Ste14
MKLVEDAKNAWKWFSVQIPVVNIALIGTWSTLPSKFQDSIPLKYILIAAVALIVLGVAGRLIDQKPKAEDAPSPDPKP